LESKGFYEVQTICIANFKSKHSQGKAMGKFLLLQWRYKKIMLQLLQAFEGF